MSNEAKPVILPEKKTPVPRLGLTAKQLIPRLQLADNLFNLIGLLSTSIGILTMVILLGALLWNGAPYLTWNFLISFPSTTPENAGIIVGLVGSLCVMLVTVVTAVPLGVAAAIYLEEYANKNWLTTIIELNISNLAGVPSIVYGLMAASLIVYQLGIGETIATGGITLGLLVLPVIIVATREALRTVPRSIREAAFAMGATKWQVIHKHLLPYSAGGIATGVIIAMSRAIGETAPLVVVGVVGFLLKLPASPVSSQFPFVNFKWLTVRYSVLPYQMFDWVQEPDDVYQHKAAAAGLVLIAMTLALNASAMYIRYRVRKNIHW